jgi:ABC-type sugar transport system ATPase subunit
LYKEADNNRTSESFKEQLGIKTPSVKQLIRKLSGGNQQKVVVAKWLNTEPDVLIINEPTHGVDVGAKADIYSILKKLTRDGKSIIMISSELPELLLLADRIAVMYAGRLQTIIDKQDATEEIITELASGLVNASF